MAAIRNPGADHAFETTWATVAPRLERALVAARIPARDRHDLIQETALRLLSHWDRIDADQDVFPLACRIALNLGRDQARRNARLAPLDADDLRAVHAVDDTAIARLELTRVFRALTRLVPRYQSLLLAELGAADHFDRATPGALKVARARARAALRRHLEDVRGLIGPVAFRCRDLIRRASQQQELGHAVGAMGLVIVVILSVAPPSTSDGSSGAGPRPQSPVYSVTTRGHRASRESLFAAAVDSYGRPRVQSSEMRTPPRDHPSLAGEAPLPDAATQGEDRGYIGTDGYHLRQHGETEVGGQTVAWRYEHEYETPPCVSRTVEGKPSTDCRSGRPSGHFEIELNGRRRRIEY